jgi:hypothetical protein
MHEGWFWQPEHNDTRFYGGLGRSTALPAITMLDARFAPFRLGRRTPLVGPNPPASSGICRYLGGLRVPPLPPGAAGNANKHGPFATRGMAARFGRPTQTENCDVLGSSPGLAIRRSGPVRVWAGDAPLPAQTPRNPQETNGMSRALRLVNSLQIGHFPVLRPLN